MSISLEGLTKSYGTTTVVDHVSQVVPTGSLTAILGPSGSGKSTLLKMIAGLERPDEGRVVIEGRDVTELDARHRDIGFCFQHYAPFRHMTVAKNIAFGLRVRRRPRAEVRDRVEELLELVRLGDKATRYPAQLSGGERQRMALARALAIEPTVLLLDEPFGALDAIVRAELRSSLRELHRQIHVTTILVTHDQGEAMEVADQLLIMHEGRIEQAGVPSDLYESPNSDFVEGFLGPTTIFDGSTVRPHSLELIPTGGDGVAGTIVEVVNLGFEVRVAFAMTDGSRPWVQLSRHEFGEFPVRVGDHVALRRRVAPAFD